MNRAEQEFEVQKAAFQISSAMPEAWDNFVLTLKLLSTQADTDCISAKPENLVPAQARARFLRDHVQVLQEHRAVVGQALERTRR